ncbi:cytochrome P450 [Epithele typhae]|uniref:cytochrome P450 n=1 Tax=Epithele typhae TaxID=378194 RepID=UPI002007C450|nr:cytochrome P450 [Epithele typhae]KAH9917917.1 cytochrome P450 [Epithele typhae]
MPVPAILLPDNINAAMRLLLAGAAMAVLLKVLKTLVSRHSDVVRRLPGPDAENWITGQLGGMFASSADLPHEWVAKFGPTFRVPSMFGQQAIFSIDPKLLGHALNHSMSYYKPPESRRNLARLLGQGVLVAEGEKHRQQRRVMNPAFGPAQIRELTQIFVEKSMNLVEYWGSMVESASGVGRVNAVEGLGRMTLDVIGIAGFDYNFDALNPDSQNPLGKAFAHIVKTPPVFTPLSVLCALLFSKVFPDKRTQAADKAQGVMVEIAKKLLLEKKAELRSRGAVEKRDVQGRDLLTLLLKSNLAADVPDDQKLTDDEVLAQIPTFLIAGHETTNTSTSWCLSSLSTHPEIQSRLREELFSLDTESPTMEDLNALPLLDRVVRETLRLHAVVTFSSRIAVHDDVLPLSTPIVDADGKTLQEIPVKAGQRIFIPILTLHTLKDLWGPDALEFSPDRWLNPPPEAMAHMPGVYGNLMTFLGGPHACIGYRFALTEMKALIFALVRAFEFSLPVPADDIAMVGIFIQRPALRSEMEKGVQMPLLIRPIRRAQ